MNILVTFICMESDELKKWMEKNGKTVMEIAQDLQLHLHTVYRFLSGKKVHRSTKVHFDRLINSDSSTSKNPKKPERKKTS